MITSFRNSPSLRQWRSSLVTVMPPLAGGGGYTINLEDSHHEHGYTGAVTKTFHFTPSRRQSLTWRLVPRRWAGGRSCPRLHLRSKCRSAAGWPSACVPAWWPGSSGRPAWPCWPGGRGWFWAGFVLASPAEGRRKIKPYIKSRSVKSYTPRLCNIIFFFTNSSKFSHQK